MSVGRERLVEAGAGKTALARNFGHAFSASDDAIFLKDLARLAGLSTYHFARAFKHSLGVPPYLYQRKWKLEQARAMLDENNRSIGEIAHLSGFGSGQSFARAFSREFGVSPTQYRREKA